MAVWLSALTLALPSIIRWDLYLKSDVSWGFNFICIPIQLYRNVERERLLEGQSLTENSHLVQKLKMKERSVAYTTFILVLVFTVCWIPVSVAVNINAWCSACLCEYNWHYVVCLTLLHPVLNPIVYSLRTARFRKAFRRVITNSIF
ncbi:unnamed protein product [Porites lobata]|uniref:G-protein coupled receptors family 1 profile domain-containing protein n=1 Tax=Porites lobata TaxID=104759 RepID=A0ABN8NS60_9CNID|nr:unnamed protein product [Porites lobata]